ncbi:MAG: helix-turn-helix domain-containing protein [Tepidanaerobacteraceae bacterium]|jgi:transcriptional regulator with XRE-family HTH domain|nr:helix-turn-helix domain-containing protein [Tepidanaerobacteraceae bacterium]
MKEIGKKIDILKGKLTYQEFSNKILEKTGVHIHYTSLQKYVKGIRKPSIKILKALSEYSQKPLSWFLEDSELNDIRTDTNFEDETCDIEEYKEVFKLAKSKKIPPEAINLFIQAVYETRKTKE